MKVKELETVIQEYGDSDQEVKVHIGPVPKGWGPEQVENSMLTVTEAKVIFDDNTLYIRAKFV